MHWHLFAHCCWCLTNKLFLGKQKKKKTTVVLNKPGPAYVKSKSLHSQPCVVSDFVLNIFVTEACEAFIVPEENVESMI